MKATTVAKDGLVKVTVTTKLARVVVTVLMLVAVWVTVVMEKQSSEIIRVMAQMHVQGLARTPRQRSEMDLVVTPMPALPIKVPLVIMLARANVPAHIMKVPSMMDVVITIRPADIIKGILKKDLRSVEAPVIIGHFVHLLITVKMVRRKLRHRSTDVHCLCTDFTVRKKIIVKEI